MTDYDLRHALDVAARIGSHGSAGMRRRIIALLHDSVEDGACDLNDILDAFGSLYAHSVKMLTRPAGLSYEEYIEGLATWGNEDELAVKMADLEANLARMDPEHESLRPRYEKALEKLKARQVRVA